MSLQQWLADLAAQRTTVRNVWMRAYWPRIETSADAHAAFYGVTREDVLGDSRGNRRVWDARQRLYVDLWNDGVTIATIGRLLGRDHTTVIHGLRKVLGDEAYEAEVRKRFPLNRASYRGAKS